MYVSPNFPTKKALKQALADGKTVLVFQQNQMIPGGITQNGSISLEGPHYPKPHTWYGAGIMKNGILVSVK